MATSQPVPDGPCKRHYDALGKIYAAEVNGRLPFQSKARVFKELEAMGLAKEAEEVMGRDRLSAIVVRGWYLTQLGRLTYCMSCQ